MITAEILTKWIAASPPFPDGLMPDIPSGVTMTDTTGTAAPVLGQSVVVRVTCDSEAGLTDYITLWSQ